MLSIQAVRGLPRLRAPGIVIVSKEKVARREIFMLAKRLSLERENERGWKSDTCRYTCPSLRTSPLVIVTANQILAPPSGPHPRTSCTKRLNAEKNGGVRIVTLPANQPHQQDPNAGNSRFASSVKIGQVDVQIIGPTEIDIK